ncbi:MAG: hypothetical protein VYA30_04660 [Myxococcota bacterium]|nr:hypothetical protein [Myxococcota bacterium]
MFSSNRTISPQSDLIPLAESLADVLVDIGDSSAAGDVLSLVSKHSVSDGVALRRAEQSFINGDATAALDALVPAWEAGSDDLHLEVQMGLAALALGLYDVVETLTDRDDFSLEHSILRWLSALSDGTELPNLDWAHGPTIWSATAMLTTLSRCGRLDIAFRVKCFAKDNSQEDLYRSISRIPSAEPVHSQPASPPLNGREQFREQWTHPGADVVFNWVWSSARQVFTGERVFMAGPQAELLAPFAEHALSDSHDSLNEEGTNSVIKPGRFEHIISIFDINFGLSPVETMQSYARGLTHEGQLHMLVAAQCKNTCFDLALSYAAIVNLCHRAGLVITGCDSRDLSGLPVAHDEADVHLFRVEKRII